MTDVTSATGTGTRPVMVSIEATYKGTDIANPCEDLNGTLVAPNGKSYPSTRATVPQSLCTQMATAGEALEGNVAFEMPSEDIHDVVMYTETPRSGAPGLYFALSDSNVVASPSNLPPTASPSEATTFALNGTVSETVKAGISCRDFKKMERDTSTHLGFGDIDLEQKQVTVYDGGGEVIGLATTGKSSDKQVPGGCTYEAPFTVDDLPKVDFYRFEVEGMMGDVTYAWDEVETLMTVGLALPIMGCGPSARAFSGCANKPVG